MDHQPPPGWEDVATKKDLEAFITRAIAWMFTIMTIYFSLLSAVVVIAK